MSSKAYERGRHFLQELDARVFDIRQKYVLEMRQSFHMTLDTLRAGYVILLGGGNPGPCQGHRKCVFVSARVDHSRWFQLR